MIFFYIKLPDDDLKKIQTCRSVSGSYVEVCTLIHVCLLVLPIKLFIIARIGIVSKCNIDVFDPKIKFVRNIMMFAV